jgi:hypothetical protein
MKDVLATGEAFNPPEEHPALPQHEKFFAFSIFVGHFCPCWIRIQQTNINANLCESETLI